MKGYKSNETRLVYLFKDGREKWKQRALSKQKKLRAMDIKVRDLALSREKWKEKALIISQAAELGRRKFLEKLGWLLDSEKQLHIYAEILEVFALAKKQLIKQGLHQKSQSDWLDLTNNFSDSTWIQKAQQKVTQYLGIEGQKIPQTQAFLATSDIIESIFGKYKIFASSASNSEIAVPGWGEYFARVYLLRPKIKCNSPHSRPGEVSYGERAPRQ